MTVVAVCLVAGALGYVQLRSLPRYQVDCGVLTLPPPGSWASANLQEDVASNLTNLGSRSIFDPRLLLELGRELEERPWVRRVVRLQRRFPSQITAVIELRHPGVAVRLEDRFFLVDQDRIRLPGEYDRIPDLGYAVPVVTGVDPVPAPAPGLPWNVGGLADGQAVAALLQATGLHEDLVVHEIDVGWDAEYRTRLITIVAGAHRTRVVWGKSPLEPDPVAEVDSGRKLEHLRFILDRYPGLAGLARVHVFEQEPWGEDRSAAPRLDGPELSSR